MGHHFRYWRECVGFRRAQSPAGTAAGIATSGPPADEQDVCDNWP